MKTNTISRTATSPLPLEQQPEHMCVAAVAACLTTTRQHIQNLVDQGLLPAVNLARPGIKRRCLRIQRSAVQEFLARRQVSL